MNYRLEFRPEVLTDIVSAAGWYDSREVGLGKQFSGAVRARIEDLLLDPTLPRIRDAARRLRWVFPKRFPYRIIYRVSGEIVLVIAVLHAARHDREWKKRGMPPD